jgi:translation initiation factor 5B
MDTPSRTEVANRLRSPIITVLGHVDHGKSSILDRIRNTAIINTEAGGITQAIGSSIVPLETIKKLCRNLKVNIDFTIPGLLFIDTPGHEAFTSLRKRGGNLADIAIVVVDINEGFKPQTIEAIEILKQYKTPFVIALNKIDLVNGFKDQRSRDEAENKTLLEILNAQDFNVAQDIEAKLYTIIGYISEHFGLESERFDRCDFTKQIAIIPCSAKTGIGIPEMLMVITGLTQKYLEQNLKYNLNMDEKNTYAKGTILEVKNVEGLGMCIDAIIYDGIMRVNDTLIIGGIDKPITTKIKGLFEPKALTDIRDKKTKFTSMREIQAATGVRISAPDIDAVIAGMPLLSCAPNNPQLPEYMVAIQKEVDEVTIAVEKEGIVIKADTLGSLEALTKLLKDHHIKIRKALIGNITKKDVSDAESNYDKDPLDAAILGFNISVDHNAPSEKVKIIIHNVIYKLIDEYKSWRENESKKIEMRQLEGLVRPCKIEYLKNYTFRTSNPAVIGAEILAGELHPGDPIMHLHGEILTNVKEIQKEKESVTIIKKGDQAALSLPGLTVGRQINEGDIFYTAIPENDFRKLKSLTKYLAKEEISIIREIAEIMRKKNPVWGV